MRWPLRMLCLAAWLATGGCSSPPDTLGELSQLSGSLEGEPGLTGDAYLFLFAPGQGPPGAPAAPLQETAVSKERLSHGDGSFVFAAIQPGSYRLWGFLDVNQNFRADVDVLAQPGAGDRPTVGAEVSLVAGERDTINVSLEPALSFEPPAFSVSDAGSVVQLPDQPVVLLSFNLLSADLGLLDSSATAFVVSTDSDSGGLPGFWPQLFLRWIPQPGQTGPTDDAGTLLSVIVPLAFDPLPFLGIWAADPGAQIATSQLSAAVVPQAQTVATAVDGGILMTALPAIPVGDYELWVVERTGQYWHVPNSLGADAGGQLSNQGVSFRFVHGTGL